MVELFRCSKNESSLWQSALASDGASISDPSVSQDNSLLQLERLSVATGRLKKNQRCFEMISLKLSWFAYLSHDEHITA